jgi:hypothetical protein
VARGLRRKVATLLAVMAVLPCLSFFKVAWDFEQKLFIQRSHLRLIDDAGVRRQIVRSSYQGVQLGGYADRLLAEPDGQEETKFSYSYQHDFLDTEIHSVGEYKNQGHVQCRLKGPAYLERCVELFLGKISPLFNEIVYDGRYLTEASQDTRNWSLTSREGKERLQLTKLGPDNNVRVISSSWTPLQIAWTDWIWWLGTLAYWAALFWLVRFLLRKIFLLDLPEPEEGHSTLTAIEPDKLIASLPRNLVLIGHSYSRSIVNLMQRKEVQVRDLYQMLSAPKVRAATPDGVSVVNTPSDPVEEIIRDGRPVIFREFERGLSDHGSNHQMLSTLEKVLSRLHKTVVLSSEVDPPATSRGDERQKWQTLLQFFMRIDLNLGPTQRTDETLEQWEGRISSGAYYGWLFSNLSKPQKLVLVQLAQEKLINPNSRSVVRELMKTGLVVRSCGTLTIRSAGFAKFLESAVSPGHIKRWESEGAGIHADALRTSLLVAGTALAVFLLYTQGALVSSWATYATGLAASIPAFLKLFDLFRHGGAAGQQV